MVLPAVPEWGAHRRDVARNPARPAVPQAPRRRRAGEDAHGQRAGPFRHQHVVGGIGDQHDLARFHTQVARCHQERRGIRLLMGHLVPVHGGLEHVDEPCRLQLKFQPFPMAGGDERDAAAPAAQPLECLRGARYERGDFRLEDLDPASIDTRPELTRNAQALVHAPPVGRVVALEERIVEGQIELAEDLAVGGLGPRDRVDERAVPVERPDRTLVERTQDITGRTSPVKQSHDTILTATGDRRDALGEDGQQSATALVDRGSRDRLAAVPDPLAPPLQRVFDTAARKGVTIEIVTFPESTHTAEEAARAVGAELGQIVKSLVFVAPREDGELEPYVVLVAGPDRVDVAQLAAVLGEPGIRRATAREANALTGFVIGGIPPFGHSRPIRVVMDPALGRHQIVWAAAGAQNAVFAVSPATLRMLANATVAPIAARPASSGSVGSIEGQAQATGRAGGA